jgi:hypothetical protein
MQIEVKRKITGKMQRRRNAIDSSKCEEAYSNRHLYFSQRVSVARRTLRQLRLSANSRLLTTLRCFVREIPAPSRRAELGDAAGMANDYTSIFINHFFPSLYTSARRSVSQASLCFSLSSRHREPQKSIWKSQNARPHEPKEPLFDTTVDTYQKKAPA